MTDYVLTEHFDAVGDWLLPDKPDRKIGGTLSWKADGARLKLNDQLDGPLKGTMALGLDTFDARYPVVNGITNESEAVTALNTLLANYSLRSGSGGVRAPIALHCDVIVFGGHVTADTKYSEMLFRVPGLEAWLSERSIRRTLSDGQINLSTAEYLEEVFNLKELDSQFVLRTSHRVSSDAHAASIRTNGYFGLRPREPGQLSWFFEHAPKITSLLTLLAGARMRVDQMLAKREAGKAAQSCSVLQRQFGENYCTYSHQREFFISRSAMTEDHAQVWNKWIGQYGRVKEACSLAMSVLTVQDLWTNVEFLSLMQALEGLHRALFNEKKLTLKKRLTALVALLPNAVRMAALGEKGSVPQKWIDTRNYYTHWDEALRPQILPLEEMYYAGVRLKLLVRGLYLQLAGVSDDTISAALKNNSEVSRYIRYLNNAHR